MIEMPRPGLDHVVVLPMNQSLSKSMSIGSLLEIMVIVHYTPQVLNAVVWFDANVATGNKSSDIDPNAFLVNVNFKLELGEWRLCL